MVSRWPVLVSLPAESGDCDEDGRLTDAGAERLFASARSTYFERCATVNPATLKMRGTAVITGGAVVGQGGVTVSVNVTEVFPDTFTMAARLRPSDTDGIAATASCSLAPAGGVSRAMRDEFIALAHAAEHVH